MNRAAKAEGISGRRRTKIYRTAGTSGSSLDLRLVVQRPVAVQRPARPVSRGAVPPSRGELLNREAAVLSLPIAARQLAVVDHSLPAEALSRAAAPHSRDARPRAGAVLLSGGVGGVAEICVRGKRQASSFRLSSLLWLRCSVFSLGGWVCCPINTATLCGLYWRR